MSKKKSGRFSSQKQTKECCCKDSTPKVCQPPIIHGISGLVYVGQETTIYILGEFFDYVAPTDAIQGNMKSYRVLNDSTILLKFVPQKENNFFLSNVCGMVEFEIDAINIPTIPDVVVPENPNVQKCLAFGKLKGHTYRTNKGNLLKAWKGKLPFNAFWHYFKGSDRNIIDFGVDTEGNQRYLIARKKGLYRVVVNDSFGTQTSNGGKTWACIMLNDQPLNAIARDLMAIDLNNLVELNANDRVSIRYEVLEQNHNLSSYPKQNLEMESQKHMGGYFRLELICEN